MFDAGILFLIVSSALPDYTSRTMSDLFNRDAILGIFADICGLAGCLIIISGLRNARKEVEETEAENALETISKVYLTFAIFSLSAS